MLDFAQLVQDVSLVFFQKKSIASTAHMKYGKSTTTDLGLRNNTKALLVIQKEKPVPLATDYTSGRTWWMFQDTIYWEDYSASEVVDQRRVKANVMMEVRTALLEGDRGPHGISCLNRGLLRAGRHLDARARGAFVCAVCRRCNPSPACQFANGRWGRASVFYFM